MSEPNPAQVTGAKPDVRKVYTITGKSLDVLELARMVGHRDLKSLMMYYLANAEALAKKLG